MNFHKIMAVSNYTPPLNGYPFVPPNPANNLLQWTFGNVETHFLDRASETLFRYFEYLLDQNNFQEEGR